MNKENTFSPGDIVVHRLNNDECMILDVRSTKCGIMYDIRAKGMGYYTVSEFEIKKAK